MRSLVKLNMTPRPKKGEVWLANLNPTNGTEPGKTRPVLILQSQALLNIAHPSTIIIPLTTRLIDVDAFPLRIRLEAKNELNKNSDLLIDQIRSIDNKRLTRGPLTRLSKHDLAQVHQALNDVIGLHER